MSKRERPRDSLSCTAEQLTQLQQLLLLDSLLAEKKYTPLLKAGVCWVLGYLKQRGILTPDHTVYVNLGLAFSPVNSDSEIYPC